MQPPYHPLFVHFPIALYFLGVLMTGLFIWQNRPDYDRFAYWSFFLSWVAAIVASLIGLIDRGQLDFDDPRLGVMNQHITQAILFMIVNGLVVYYRFRWPDLLTTSRRWVYLGLLLLGIVFVVAAGKFGGDLVYSLQIGIR